MSEDKAGVSSLSLIQTGLEKYLRDASCHGAAYENSWATLQHEGRPAEQMRTLLESLGEVCCAGVHLSLGHAREIQLDDGWLVKLIAAAQEFDETITLNYGNTGTLFTLFWVQVVVHRSGECHMRDMVSAAQKHLSQDKLIYK